MYTRDTKKIDGQKYGDIQNPDRRYQGRYFLLLKFLKRRTREIIRLIIALRKTAAGPGKMFIYRKNKIVSKIKRKKISISIAFHFKPR